MLLGLSWGMLLWPDGKLNLHLILFSLIYQLFHWQRGVTSWSEKMLFSAHSTLKKSNHSMFKVNVWQSFLIMDACLLSTPATHSSSSGKVNSARNSLFDNLCEGGKRKKYPSLGFFLYCRQRQFYKVNLNLCNSFSNSALLPFLSHIFLNCIVYCKSKLKPGKKVYKKAINFLEEGEKFITQLSRVLI